MKQRGGELIVLQQPQHPKLIKIWDEPCDILFYWGHSNTTRSYQSGIIYINQDDYMDNTSAKATEVSQKEGCTHYLNIKISFIVHYININLYLSNKHREPPSNMTFKHENTNRSII